MTPMFRRRPGTVIATTALIGSVLLSGCGGGSTNTTASSSPSTDTGAMTSTGGSTTGGSADGAQLFADNCESCHGAMGTGGHVGPDLQKSAFAEKQANVVTRVTNGKGVMPSFQGVLTDQEIEAVAAYVSGTLAPMQ